MPFFEPSQLNIVLGGLGTFVILYGILSIKIRQSWYLGCALPSMLFGIVIGPAASRLIDSEKWGPAEREQTHVIALGLVRVMIGLQLLIAGYQLPAKYCWIRLREMALCLLPIMSTSWLCTTLCVLATVPNLPLLSALVIASCVACTDPVLSQAIAKGPFADFYVRRPLREIISAEAGANDGFGFPFVMLSVFLLRHNDESPIRHRGPHEHVEGAANIASELDGSVGETLKAWFLETWLYVIILSVVYGAIFGYGLCRLVRFCHNRRWVDNESYLLLPAAMGLFIVGTCGALGTDDSLACFTAGCALNWDGHYLRETRHRRDEVNTCIDLLLNFGGFCYIGTIIPWSEFQDPTGTGLTWWRLLLLGVMVIFFRRIPSLLVFYKLMPSVCENYKEAIFMGYFGPIGAGAVFYVEYARRVLNAVGEGKREEEHLMKVLSPVVYFLVFFSIVVHGLSIPALNLIYKYMGVKPIHVDAVEIRRLSSREGTPANAMVHGRHSFLAYNRFSRPCLDDAELPIIESAPSSDRCSTLRAREEFELTPKYPQRPVVAVPGGMF